ncbi:MAG TPA: efflux RND transporter periplasmic adaptor subunit [Bryobacteraceae bacterium]|jgi:cobalt-zinc-cadmium efflux system membrane fusion protein
MKRKRLCAAGLAGALCLATAACTSKAKTDPAAEAPPATQVTQAPDLDVVKVDRPKRFPLVAAAQREELPEIHVTGVVSPDIEKSVPVVSLAAGRVAGIYAKLGDDVRKGQLLLKIVSNDIAGGIQTYRQALADEDLARKQLERAQLLYEHGAISLNDLQVAQGAEEKAKVAVEVSTQQLRTMGADVNHPDAVINVYAPIEGTIVEQNVVGTSAVHTPDNQPNLFTIANLSTVWIVCNVYENDLPNVAPGDTADVRLNAYADHVLRGRVSNIGKVLDANIRTAPVRIVLANPGMMRAGMFATATLYGKHGRVLATVPTTAVLHLHDRDWVFVPTGAGEFRRREITTGKSANGMQDVIAGLRPGEQVVQNALALSAESEQ